MQSASGTLGAKGNHFVHYNLLNIAEKNILQKLLSEFVSLFNLVDSIVWHEFI